MCSFKYEVSRPSNHAHHAYLVYSWGDPEAKSAEAAHQGSILNVTFLF